MAMMHSVQRMRGHDITMLSDHHVIYSIWEDLIYQTIIFGGIRSPTMMDFVWHIKCTAMQDKSIV